MNNRDRINTLINSDVKSTTKFLSGISEVVYNEENELIGVELRNQYYVPIEMLSETEKELVNFWITDNELLEECYILILYGEV